MYRAGVIGLGFIGCEAPDNHMKAYRDCPDTRLVALCDVNESLLFEWKSVVLERAALFTDYKAMIEEVPLDIVSVCTPPETHCQIVCDIAPYVRAIYVEKPIALTLEDADKMIETCHKYGVILQVNHQRRFVQPVFRFSRGIMNTGTHMFDLLRFLFGDIVILNKEVVALRDGITCKIEEVDTDKSVFEFDCTHNSEPMILKGVEHLVECLDEELESISSGEEAREALRLCLEYQNAH